MKMRMSKP